MSRGSGSDAVNGTAARSAEDVITGQLIAGHGGDHDSEVMMSTVSTNAASAVHNAERSEAWDVARLLNEIAALPSESLSGMMRGARIAFGYQCEDAWVIEQVRHRFLYFVKHCLKSAGTREDAWAAYVKNFHAVRDSWKCSFAGSTDYACGSLAFEVRSYANPNMGWAEGYFDSGIMKQLGCVFRRCSMSDGYPPAEVIAAFPGYTPLTATFDWVADAGSFLGKRVENRQYVCHPDFEPPRHGEMQSENHTAYMDIDWNRIDFERDIKPYRHSK